MSSKNEIEGASSRRHMPLFGWIGLLILVGGSVLLYSDVRLDALYFTPIMWTGYILFADGIIWRRGGDSLFKDHPREWPMLALLSVLIWLLFEAYNFKVRQWGYANVVTNPALRVFSYFWAFATICPALFRTAELLKVLGVFRHTRLPAIRFTPTLLAISFVVGIAFAALPLATSEAFANNLIPLVFTTFIFLIEPINYRLGAPSLYRQIEQGEYGNTLRLMVGGLICGFLWETWNYQALLSGGMVWTYHLAPIYIISIDGHVLKYGEMPILGFLGYPPFAWECFALYYLGKWAMQGDKLWVTHKTPAPVEQAATGSH